MTDADTPSPMTTAQKILWHVFVLLPLLIPLGIAFALDALYNFTNKHFILPVMELWLRAANRVLPKKEAAPVEDIPSWLQMPPIPERGECCCHKCCWLKHGRSPSWMALCSICGNKRCPKATDCDEPCTQSNEPGQAKSVYGPGPTIIDAIKEGTHHGC